MNNQFTKMLRRVVPSMAKLSYVPAFKILGNLFSRIPVLFFPEFKTLPPNHLRVRVGVGNKIFNNHFYHWKIGSEIWLEWLACGYCSRDSNIIEIGSGCGRIAQHLDADWFKGTYLGIDIDVEMIEWCQSHFPKPNFRFTLSPHQSTTYSVGVPKPNKSKFSFKESETADFLFSTSLLTHLLESDVINYISEASKVLRPGGYMVMTFFSMQHVTLGGRWTFSNRLGNAYVENLSLPEAAVAYDDDFLIEQVKLSGFSEVHVIPSAGQSKLIARR